MTIVTSLVVLRRFKRYTLYLLGLIEIYEVRSHMRNDTQTFISLNIVCDDRPDCLSRRLSRRPLGGMKGNLKRGPSLYLAAAALEHVFRELLQRAPCQRLVAIYIPHGEESTGIREWELAHYTVGRINICCNCWSLSRSHGGANRDTEATLLQ